MARRRHLIENDWSHSIKNQLFLLISFSVALCKSLIGKLLSFVICFFASFFLFLFNFISWENCWPFATLLLVSPRNDAEEQAQKFHINDANPMNQSDSLPRSEKWRVTSMEFSVRKQASFRWETSFCVVKCRLSSQAKLNEAQSCFSLLHSDRASEAGSEFSLFEALRDSIYSEVATLISLNESRPHFLVRHHHVRFSVSLTWLLFFLWFRLVFPISIVMYFCSTSSERPLWGESMYGLPPPLPPPPKKWPLWRGARLWRFARSRKEQDQYWTELNSNR